VASPVYLTATKLFPFFFSSFHPTSRSRAQAAGGDAVSTEIQWMARFLGGVMELSPSFPLPLQDREGVSFFDCP